MPTVTRKPNFYKNLKSIYQKGLKYPWAARQNTVFATDTKTSPFRDAIANTNDFEIYMGAEFKIPFEKHLEYRYAIAIEGNDPNYALPELLISGCCVIVLAEKGHGYETFFLKQFSPNRDFLLVEYEKGAKPTVIIEQIKESIRKNNGNWIANNSRAKALNLLKSKRLEILFARELNHYSKRFEREVYPNYMDYYQKTMPLSKYFYDTESDFTV